MDKLTLLNHLKAPLSKTWVNRLSVQLINEGFELTGLLRLTLDQHQQTAFRAAWLLDALVLNNPGNYANRIDLFIQYGKQARHHSCHRHYARVFMFFTSAKAEQSIKLAVSKTNMEPVIELYFDWIIDPKVKVAVKSCGQNFV